jgi:sugar/nucleoside kinase (ribokinase family)
VDVLFANDFEAERMTGLNLRRGNEIVAEQVQKAAGLLLQGGVGEWVILHFPEGTYARDSAGKDCWQASVRLPTEQIKGASGAGDALAAAVIYGLHEEWPIRACLELGVAAAAASLRDSTCSGAVCPVEECRLLAKSYGYHPLPA